MKIQGQAIFLWTQRFDRSCVCNAVFLGSLESHFDKAYGLPLMAVS